MQAAPFAGTGNTPGNQDAKIQPGAYLTVILETHGGIAGCGRWKPLLRHHAQTGGDKTVIMMLLPAEEGVVPRSWPWLTTWPWLISLPGSSV
jgi:hypothetical protein